MNSRPALLAAVFTMLAAVGANADENRRVAVTFDDLPVVASSLLDAAYESPDTYAGPGGSTWLHRWAITGNVDPKMFLGEPDTPEHILQLTQLPEHTYPTSE